MWMARSFRPLGPPRVGRTTVKRGPDQARRRRETRPRIRTCRWARTYRWARTWRFREAGSPPLIHLPRDRQDFPLGAVLSVGQHRRSAFFSDLMNQVSVPPPPRTAAQGAPKRPEGDRAYDADWIRQWCADKGIKSAITARKNIREGLERSEIPRPNYGRALRLPPERAPPPSSPVREKSQPFRSESFKLCSSGHPPRNT
jgi:hypothetical protein